jgi:hypothetical protein
MLRRFCQSNARWLAGDEVTFEVEVVVAMLDRCEFLE